MLIPRFISVERVDKLCSEYTLAYLAIISQQCASFVIAIFGMKRIASRHRVDVRHEKRAKYNLMSDVCKRVEVSAR